MARKPIFIAARGLNNAIEPHRLTYAEDGSCDLAESVNVIIDDSGSIMRRFGIIEKYGSPAHSLWSKNEYCFFVSAGNLMRYLTSGSTVQVLAGVGDATMYYTWFQGRVWASNRTSKIILKDMTVSSWDAVTPQISGDTRVLGMPSSFGPIAAHAGRIFVADGNLLYESEPGNARAFSMSELPLVFDSEIIGLLSVGTVESAGLFVFTKYSVVFLAGHSREDFIMREVLNEPAVPGTICQCPMSEISEKTSSGQGGYWVCQTGVYQGYPDGSVRNVTNGRLKLDSAISGAAAVLPGQFFFSLEV